LKLYNFAYANNYIKKNANYEEIKASYTQIHNSEYLWINLSADKETLLKVFKAYIDSNQKHTVSEKIKYRQKYLEKIKTDFNKLHGETLSQKASNNLVFQYFDLIWRIVNSPYYISATFKNPRLKLLFV